MIRGGFLTSEDRADLIALARDGSAAHRLARRANALVLLDAGWNCEKVAVALARWTTTRSAGGATCSSRNASRGWRVSKRAAALAR
jgi:hypothetical protein